MKPIALAFAIAGIFAVALALIVGAASRDASAVGIPAVEPLYYAGTLLDATDGTPVDGTRSIDIYVWDNAGATGSALCSTAGGSVAVSRGRFRVALSAACVAVVHDNTELWVEVRVDGASLGVSKLGAVPFAVEAEAAVAAETAAAADTAATLGSLAPGDVALAGHGHAGSYLPVGATLSCGGGQKVTAVSASSGDLTCQPEGDPVFEASVAAGISAADTTAWNTAYGWGDHGAAGYSTGAHTTVTAGNGLTGGGTGAVTLDIGAGPGISVGSDLVSHADTSAQPPLDNSNGVAIQDVTVDTYGHVTGLASVDLDGRYFTEAETGQRFLATDATQAYRVVTGKVDFSAAAGYSETSDISFPTAFAVAPTISITQEITGTCGTANLGVRYVTATKFRVWQSGAGCSGAFRVHWTAIGY